MAISKSDAKERISKLVEHFQKDLESGRANKYSEEETKTRYIQPLFEALGWDFSASSDEVSMEENISKKRVDYGFRINGIPKFFVEAKRVKADLNDSKYAEQAIDYSWHKDCTWAILTDFDGLKVFNAEWKYGGDPSINIFKSFRYYEYVSRFEELWMLSRESMEKGELSAEALKVHKKIKKTPVGKQIFDDMMRWRGALSKNIIKHNSKLDISSDELDEAVQRILDRLVFIRTAEDRHISVGPKLLELVRDYQSRKRGKLSDALKDLFHGYDKAFNSRLFAMGHFSEDLNIDNSVLIDVIRGMYRTDDGSIHYDFSAINADVLGNMYEQYLGHLLKKTAKRAKVEKSRSTRKEHGIYYTPTYVVDYIVKNTVGAYLKGKRTSTVSSIKVLDPACGSGSFLLRVFDELDSYWSAKLKGEYKQSKLGADEVPITKKIEILRDNIYGVDLDEKAVEISRLNLLLKAAEKRHLLPSLDKNVKVGNSLIDDASVAGDKAFVWDSEFEKIMSEGGFDVIVGNPPWVESKKFDSEDKGFYEGRFDVAKKQYDLFSLFVERSLACLREGGLLGFIIPDRFLTNLDYVDFRRFILDNCKIVKILHLGDGVFKEVRMPSAILILQKESNDKLRDKNPVKYSLIRPGQELSDMYDVKVQKEFLDNPNQVFSIFSDGETSRIIEKIKKDSVPFGDLVTNARGVEIGKSSKLILPNKTSSNQVKFLVGKDIDRYYLHSNSFLQLGEGGIDYKDAALYSKPKILIRKTGSGIRAVLDTENHYVIQVIYMFKPKDPFVDPNYLLGILNSKLMSFYYFSVFGERDRKTFPHLTQGKVLSLPFRVVSKEKQAELASLVQSMQKVVCELEALGGKRTDKALGLMEKRSNLDKQIDQIVYGSYGITEKEKKIIQDILVE